MPKWNEEELTELEGILRRLEAELEPLPGKEVLVLCSGGGEIALWLGKRMEGNGRVVGLDLNDELFHRAEERARAEGLEGIVQFRKAEMHRIPFPDGTFDVLVSEFIVYPTPLITQIGQPEMARVLKPGGVMVLTDVIVTKPLEEEAEHSLKSIGLDYLCEANQDDFYRWMQGAGLVEIEIDDLTPLLREIWEGRRGRDPAAKRRAAYSLLLEDPQLRLGAGIFYIYVRGRKR